MSRKNIKSFNDDYQLEQSGAESTIKGPDGDQGIQGIQGEVGPIGEQGIQGEVGEDGVQGLQGQVGDEGRKVIPQEVADAANNTDWAKYKGNVFAQSPVAPNNSQTVDLNLQTYTTFDEVYWNSYSDMFVVCSNGDELSNPDLDTRTPWFNFYVLNKTTGNWERRNATISGITKNPTHCDWHPYLNLFFLTSRNYVSWPTTITSVYTKVLIYNPVTNTVENFAAFDTFLAALTTPEKANIESAYWSPDGKSIIIASGLSTNNNAFFRHYAFNGSTFTTTPFRTVEIRRATASVDVDNPPNLKVEFSKNGRYIFYCTIGTDGDEINYKVDKVVNGVYTDLGNIFGLPANPSLDEGHTIYYNPSPAVIGTRWNITPFFSKRADLDLLLIAGKIYSYDTTNDTFTYVKDFLLYSSSADTSGSPIITPASTLVKTAISPNWRYVSRGREIFDLDLNGSNLGTYDISLPLQTFVVGGGNPDIRPNIQGFFSPNGMYLACIRKFTAEFTPSNAGWNCIAVFKSSTEPYFTRWVKGTV